MFYFKFVIFSYLFTCAFTQNDSSIKKGVLVTTAKKWLAGTTEKITFVSKGFNGISLNVNVTIVKDSTNVLIDNNFIWSPENIFEHEVSVPNDIFGSVNLRITVQNTGNDSLYYFNKTEMIIIDRINPLIFIQMDKPIYKPSDKVRIRILSLYGPGLQILEDNIEFAYIEDPLKTRVIQWSDIVANIGIYSFELQLSDQPRLGIWTFSAKIKGLEHSEAFEVKEYVLPKYEVNIIHPSSLYVGSPKLEWSICAKYTYGKPVTGRAKTSFCMKKKEYYRYPMYVRDQLSYCVNLNKSLEQDGCTHFEHNSIAFNTDRHWESELEIKATVYEQDTGVSLNASKEIDFSFIVYKIDISSQNNHYYKPGLPYLGKGLITKENGEGPVKNFDITVSIVGMASQIEIVGVDINFSISITTDENGIFNFIIPNNITSSSIVNSIRIKAKATSFERKNTLEQEAQNEVYLTPWYSSSNSFLQIYSANTEEYMACGSLINFNIQFISEQQLAVGSSFIYQVQSKGNTVLSGIIQPTFNIKVDENGKYLHLSSTQLTLNGDLSGAINYIVYYIRDDGEIIADSISIHLNPCFKNKVSIEFTSSQERPGHDASLKLSANSKSLCSVSVFDKSLDLLSKGKKLTTDKVLEIMKQFDLSKPSSYKPHVNEKTCAFINKTEESQRERPYFRNYYHNSINSDHVDSLLAFEISGMVSLTDLSLVTRICSRSEQRMIFPAVMQISGGMGLPGVQRNGLYYSRRINRPIALEVTSDSKALDNDIEEKSSSSKLIHRDFFPETWLWELYSMEELEEKEVKVSMPHTITEWIGNGFCANKDSGLGISPEFAIKGFQPFFMSFTLPYSLVRGESVIIPISIFNYLKDCLQITLNITKTPAFDIIQFNTNSVSICGHQSKTINVTIMAKQLGKHNFTVKATSRLLNTADQIENIETDIQDSVTHALLVEPEGKKEEVVSSVFICAPASGELVLELPNRRIVKDSNKSSISVIGNIMGPSLSNLDKLLQIPTGCGEQNMVKFVPNIFVLQFLNSTNNINGDLIEKSKTYLQTGYQRELTYRRDDASYSAFGKMDSSGSIWLTAFVIKSFAQAKKFIFIDNNDLHISVEWIKSKQLENGCFPQVGKLLDKSLKGGLSNNDDDDDFSLIPLTAYITSALLESGINKDDPVIANAFLCLSLSANDEEDLYTQSLLLYAFSLLGNPDNVQYKKILNKVERLAHLEDGLKYWSNSSEKVSESIEMTSYILLSQLILEDAVDKITPITQWLTTKRNSHGGFHSTQDTVLALQALSAYAEKIYRDDTNLNITIADIRKVRPFKLNHQNQFLLQKVEKVVLPNRIRYNVSGTGCVLLQASTKFNTYLQATQQYDISHFNLSVGIKNSKSSCNEKVFHACFEYNGEDKTTNMAIMSIKLPSGWQADKKSVDQLTNSATLKLKKYEINQNNVELYFDEIGVHRQCLHFTVIQEIFVSHIKPGLVRLYDYYEAEQETIVEYNILNTCIKSIKSRNSNNGSNHNVKSCPECKLDNEQQIIRKLCNATHVYKIELDDGRYEGTLLKSLNSPFELNSSQTMIKIHLNENCDCQSLMPNTSIFVASSNRLELKRTSSVLKLKRLDYVIKAIDEATREYHAYLVQFEEPNLRNSICQNL